MFMTCPAGWRGAAVRRYVEAEFGSVGARVFRAYVHPPPPGAVRGAAAVADVHLDYAMGRPKLGNAVSAMLGAPPRRPSAGSGSDDTSGAVGARVGRGAGAQGARGAKKLRPGRGRGAQQNSRGRRFSVHFV